MLANRRSSRLLAKLTVRRQIQFIIALDQLRSLRAESTFVFSKVSVTLFPSLVDAGAVPPCKAESEEEGALLAGSSLRRRQELFDACSSHKLKSGKVSPAVSWKGWVDNSAVWAADPTVFNGRTAVKAGIALDVTGVGVVVQLLHDPPGVVPALRED